MGVLLVGLRCNAGGKDRGRQMLKRIKKYGWEVSIALASIALALIVWGLISTPDDSPPAESQRWQYVGFYADYSAVGSMDNCRQNEERIGETILPSSLHKGAYLLKVEACVQTDGRDDFRRIMDELAAQFRGLDDTLPGEVYVSTLNMVLRDGLAYKAQDGRGNALPRTYSTILKRQVQD